MGILDDAIREHLDLKRKHGSPEEELQRQEEEALGPARRKVGQQAEAPEAEADGDPEAAATALDESALPGDEEAPADAPTELLSPPAEPEPEPEPPAPDTEESEAVYLDGPSEAGSRGLSAVREEEAGDRPATGTTEEYDLFADEEERALPEGEEERMHGDEEGDGTSGEADVLEDTPDFLQETPEHDRLWFEQKPPRDFDFD